ncbi:MAG: DUF4835 family protein [Bacteroidota bacterium]|nr:DUF4835 family protein [Bacteroidota bacterium]MDP4288023.1 DUF4835 family protein [Bacteroidota bacterium]
MKAITLRHILASLLAFFLGILSSATLRADELDAQVNLNLSALSAQDRIAFDAFKHDLEGYINNYEWTTNFSGERIHCTFQFNIVSSNGSDYTAQLFVTSSRPLYKSDQVTTMARFFDPNCQFSYYRGQELQHGNSFRSLESVIDFYVYIVLGLDFDSYKLQSGTPYFQQAQQVAIVANAAKGPGWEQSVTSIGTYSRLGYIDDALNGNNRAFRDLIFQYHYNGLDLLVTKPDEARITIGTVIDSLVSLRRISSDAGRSVFLRAFFEAKNQELADLARLFPDNLTAYFQKLGFLDPVHQSYYEDARAKMSQ